MQLIGHNEVVNRVRLSKSQIMRLENANKFPPRIRLTERTVVWDKDAIDAWVQQRQEASHG
ncbi:AlpA family phage regulatory protein [Mariprofundus erugo]|uniref:helix-turn-helix transcriptional regulator n=1 Tax=Mariprofundus erugo TaxID=2528639 RepID=UPI0010FD5D86|nr:AlpA family phage regulatory protein [Mariprofundus erugo]TLS78273.1 AlpA family phage regulatory protein [Mariprofundus erugo]